MVQFCHRSFSVSSLCSIITELAGVHESEHIYSYCYSIPFMYDAYFTLVRIGWSTHPIIHPSLHSFVPRLYSRSFFHSSYIHLFIPLCMHSFVRSLFTHSLIHSFIHSFIHLFHQPIMHSMNWSFNQSFNHSIIKPFNLQSNNRLIQTTKQSVRPAFFAMHQLTKIWRGVSSWL